jgi:oxygen-dependent protoporphyrinogen oxidase
VPPGAPGVERSIAEFMEARFGTETWHRLMEPLLTGIFAGDGRQLSADAAFPNLVALEQKHGSLLRAMRAAPSASGLRPGFLSLRGGLGALVAALADAGRASGVDFVPEAPVGAILRSDFGFDILNTSFDEVVIATDCTAASRLTATLSPDASAALAEIPTVSTVTVSLVFPSSGVHRPASGHGYVLPRTTERPALAVTFVSSKWSGRTNPGQFIVRVFLGRAGDERWIDETDSVVAAAALAEVNRTLSLSVSPDDVVITRWQSAMPQYTIGHRARIALLESAVSLVPGLHLTGNYLRGVGIPDCIREATVTANRIVAGYGTSN